MSRPARPGRRAHAGHGARADRGGGLLVAVPAAVVAALAGTPPARRLAFPAVMLLTVLDVVLLLTSGAGVT